MDAFDFFVQMGLMGQPLSHILLLFVTPINSKTDYTYIFHQLKH